MVKFRLPDGEARPLQHRSAGRGWRHGGDLPGHPGRSRRVPEAGDPQADPQRHLRRPPVPQHVHRRGAHLDEPRAQQHRPGAGPRVAQGPLLPGARAGGRLGPRTRDAARRRRGRPGAARARSLHHRRRLPGARLCPQQDRRPEAARHRPPRRQPPQRAAVRAGRGEADRLRHRQGDEQARADRHRRGQGQGRVHVARAGDGQADRPALGPVLARARCSIC